MSGCQATSQRIQSSRRPYNICGFSHLPDKENQGKTMELKSTLYALRIAEHLLEIDLLLAVGTRLLLAHNTPATYAELVEHMIARQLVCILDDALFLLGDQQLVATNGTDILIQMPGGNALRCVVLRG